MYSFRVELMLRLARELATSHGTFFAAALLADMGVPLSLALAALACQPRATRLMRAGAPMDGGKGIDRRLSPRPFPRRGSKRSGRAPRS